MVATMLSSLIKKFTSVKLCVTLLQHSFYATRTVKRGSKGYLSSLAGFSAMHRLPRSTLVVKMHRSQKIVVVVWMDSKPVWLLSTMMNPVDPTTMAPREVLRE